jgi:pimeloyl-ACP methyl ester carboxylesterase
MSHSLSWYALARAGAAVALAVGALGGLSAAPARADSGISCQEYLVPVTVSAPGMSVAGQLCVPAGGASVVMVLVPGATYNSAYWDFPYDPPVYNFRLAMNDAGYATMTVDRLGTGRSSKPLSATVTAEDQALAVHEVIGALRGGQLRGQSFSSVVIGGHSLGSTVVIWEAATYHDVDGVLLTGISHHLNLANLGLLLATMYPAPLDPKFAGSGLDPGYLTTKPGTRKQDFDAPGNPDPGVVSADEATKDVFSTTEAPDGVAALLLPASTSINVPVLLANGQYDKYMCGAGTDCSTAASLAASEARYFSAASHLQTYVLPGSGHDINLAPDTQLYQQAVLSWLAGQF